MSRFAFSTVALALAYAAPAQAALVKYAFTAELNVLVEYEAVTGKPNYLLTSTVPGTAFSHDDIWHGTLVYDDNLSLSSYQADQTAQSSEAVYRGFMGMTLENVNTGFSYNSFIDSTWPPILIVSDEAAQQGYDSVYLGTGFYFAENATVDFFDWTATLLNSSAVPATLRLGDGINGRATYAFVAADGTKMYANARMTSLTRVDVQSPVPEPSTYAMLGLGLAALAMTKRLRRA